MLDSIYLPFKIFSLAAGGLLQGLLFQSLEMNQRGEAFWQRISGGGGGGIQKTPNPLTQQRNETFKLLLKLRKRSVHSGIIQCFGSGVILSNTFPIAWLFPRYLHSHACLYCSGFSFHSQTPPKLSIPSANSSSDLSFHLPGSCQALPLTSRQLIPESPGPVFSEFCVYWPS